MDYPGSPTEVSLPGDLRRLESVVLFLRSARRARSGFELDEENLPYVARICQLVQGMPLAILLAAAWTPALTPAEIAVEVERGLDFLSAEWRDEPERHHSMRAVFDATWARLSGKERACFARLSVFSGGFTREAAQAVAEADLHTLISLLNKSLLQRERTGRYQIQELLRQYGESTLEAQPEEKERALDLHCAYYADFFDHKSQELTGDPGQEILAELDNLQTAWQHAVSHRLVAHLARPGRGLDSFDWDQGMHQERYATLGQAIQALRSETPAAPAREEETLLGYLLEKRASSAFFCGHTQQAAQLLHESEKIWRDLGEKERLAMVLLGRACYSAVEDDAEAEHVIQESLSLWREAGREEMVERALTALAELAIRRGAYSEAERYCQAALTIRKGDKGWALWALGYIAYRRGEYTEARRRFESRLATLRQSRIVDLEEADLIYNLGRVSFALGEYKDAARLYQQAFTRFQDIHICWTTSMCGHCRGTGPSLIRLGDVALATGDATEAGRRYAQGLHIAADEPYSALKLEAVLGQARLLAHSRESADAMPERSAELAALVLCHPDVLPETREAADRLLQEVQTRLSPAVYVAAQERGRVRDLDETVEELLLELENPAEWLSR
jgi:tetratricopeptide (TPR) repeat protein